MYCFVSSLAMNSGAVAAVVLMVCCWNLLMLAYVLYYTSCLLFSVGSNGALCRYVPYTVCVLSVRVSVHVSVCARVRVDTRIVHGCALYRGRKNSTYKCGL